MSIRFSSLITLLLLALTVPAAPAIAGQRLVGSGQKWDQLRQIAPGDEIVLMPGKHRPGRMAGLRGTAENPIIIRSLSADRPAVIEADNEGIRLDGPRHVIIKDLIIDGAVINGITIAPPREHRPKAGLWDAHIRIENVTVKRTGPTGKRHGIQLVNLAHAQVVGCTIEGWGGAGIDLLRCTNVSVKRCRLTGLPSHGQESGIHVRAGSDTILIDDCMLRDTGVFGIFLGGTGNPSLIWTGDWQSAPDPAASTDPEASGVQVRRCVVLGTSCPVQFRATRDCTIRNLTMVRPREVVLAIDIDPPAEVPTASTKLVFANNLVVWNPGDLKRLVHTGPGYRTGAIAFDQNLWWSEETPEQRLALGELPEEPRLLQIENIDPQLDETLHPQARKAKLMGFVAP